MKLCIGSHPCMITSVIATHGDPERFNNNNSCTFYSVIPTSLIHYADQLPLCNHFSQCHSLSCPVYYIRGYSHSNFIQIRADDLFIIVWLQGALSINAHVHSINMGGHELHPY